MIEDLEWRFVDNQWTLHANDGHVWFPVPFSDKKFELSITDFLKCGGCNGKGHTGGKPGIEPVTCHICGGSGKGK